MSETKIVLDEHGDLVEFSENVCVVSFEINDYKITNCIIEIRKPIYMEPVSPHALRRTFCTRCFEAGMNIKVVQKIMGHSNYAVTANIYTEVMPDKMNEEVELFNSKLLTM